MKIILEYISSNIGIILSVIGIVLEICLGIRRNRKAKKKTILRFEEMQCYSLFRNDDLTRLDIEIKYNEQVLSNALILLKAKIINNGYSDIDNSRIFVPINISLQKEFTLLNVTQIEQEEPIAKVEIVNNAIRINWDLFKSEESIKFEALIKASNNINAEDKGIRKLLNRIEFYYRIANLRNTRREEVSIINRVLLIEGILYVLLGLAFLILYPLGFSPEFEQDNRIWGAVCIVIAIIAILLSCKKKRMIIDLGR